MYAWHWLGVAVILAVASAPHRGRRAMRATLVCAPVLVALGAAPAYAQTGAFELNDTFAQAFGPLAGGSWYAAAKETANDEDYYYFGVSRPAQLDIAVTAPGSCSWVLELYDQRQSYKATAYPNAGDTPAHILWTVQPGVWYLKAWTGSTAGPTCTYTFRIDPADAVTTAVAPPST